MKQALISADAYAAELARRSPDVANRVELVADPVDGDPRPRFTAVAIERVPGTRGEERVAITPEDQVHVDAAAAWAALTPEQFDAIEAHCAGASTRAGQYVPLPDSIDELVRYVRELAAAPGAPAVPDSVARLFEHVDEVKQGTAVPALPQGLNADVLDAVVRRRGRATG